MIVRTGARASPLSASPRTRRRCHSSVRHKRPEAALAHAQLSADGCAFLSQAGCVWCASWATHSRRSRSAWVRSAGGWGCARTACPWPCCWCAARGARCTTAGVRRRNEGRGLRHCGRCGGRGHCCTFNMHWHSPSPSTTSAASSPGTVARDCDALTSPFRAVIRPRLAAPPSWCCRFRQRLRRSAHKFHARHLLGPVRGGAALVSTTEAGRPKSTIGNPPGWRAPKVLARKRVAVLLVRRPKERLQLLDHRVVAWQRAAAPSSQRSHAKIDRCGMES